MSKLIFYLFFIILSTSLLFPQTGALPLMTIQQSPLLLGAGQIGAAIPNDDVIGFYFNPAILGYSSRNNHVSIHFMPSKTKWIYNYPQLTFNNLGLNFGYNFKQSNLQLPISLGLGYLYNKFYYGKSKISTAQNPEGIDAAEAYDSFNAFSLGLGFDYYVKLNIGISLKTFNTVLSTDPNVIIHKADGTMIDYGTLLILPISDIFLNPRKFNLLKPNFDISAGYSLSNCGNEITYSDLNQTEPISRTVRVGYTANFGLDIFLDDVKFNLFNYSFTAEAQDLLINFFDEGSYKYKSGIGDINISKNLFSLKSSNNVIIHKGHIFKFLDSFILTSGRFFGNGYYSSRKTYGFGFSSKGIFNLLSKISDDASLHYILNNFTMEYHNANVEFFSGYPTIFDGISVRFEGITF